MADQKDSPGGSGREPLSIEPLAMGGRATIAVVEDDPDALLLLHRLLAGAGYRVIDFPSADAILEAAGAELGELEVRLIVTDLAMPGLGGDVLIRRLKQHPNTRHIPILAVTAHGLDPIGYRARVAGCDGLIEKPFRAATVLDAVARLLGWSGSGDAA